MPQLRLVPCLLAPLLLVLAGCTCCPDPCCRPRARRAAPAPARPPTPRVEAPAPNPLSRLYFDADGNTSSLETVLTDAADADLIALGELHGHPVGAELERRLLVSLAERGDRPVALAMEFLERDVQPVLDRYLAGEIDLATFKQEARQGRAYDATHGPLIEYAKANDIPVIAANAPRPLVSAYRKQDLEYDAWLETLSDEERATLPRSTSTPDDDYKQGFLTLMGPKRGPAFFRAQALWDDAMAEAVADFRADNPEHRVLLIVGVFHVTKRLGTITKYLERRPDDQVHVIALSMDTEHPLAWAPDAAHAGDAIVRVVPQPKPKPKASPHRKSPSP